MPAAPSLLRRSMARIQDLDPQGRFRASCGTSSKLPAVLTRHRNCAEDSAHKLGNSQNWRVPARPEARACKHKEDRVNSGNSRVFWSFRRKVGTPVALNVVG